VDGAAECCSLKQDKTELDQNKVDRSVQRFGLVVLVTNGNHHHHICLCFDASERHRIVFREVAASAGAATFGPKE